MGIDRRLEEKLGFDKVRALLSDRCSTDYALQRIAEETFSTKATEIRKRLLLTDEMRLIAMFEETFPTTGYIDALPFLVPLEKDGSSIDLLSLGKLKTLLDTVRRLVHFFSSIKDGIYPNLKRFSAKVMTFPEVLRRIDTILDKFGEVKDTASDELYNIRKTIRDKESALSKRAAALLRKAIDEGLADADAALSVRDGKLLIPINSSSKRKLPGFVHDTSATGKTTFVEFSEFVRPYVPDLEQAATYLGEIDFLMAKALTALDFKAGMPVISEDGQMNLRKARHPLLERALHKEGKEIVPLTVTLTPQKHLLLISGPNAGGKSVCLKTTGLLQYMFQWGMLIPTSETSELPVFDRIMVSIGDDQSLENDLSTYSSFLADMRQMLDRSDEKTLVLIDEFGSGTEPTAGGAIAEAILAEFDKRGVYGVITTHYTNLKLYAAGAETGVINGAMQFDAQHIVPLFQLEIGLPGNSFAFELARKMGLPEAVVKDAETRSGEEFVGIERNLRKIARNRRALDEKLQHIRNTDKTLESLTGKYQKELEGIRQMKKDILDDAKRQAEEIVRGANKQVENTIRTIKESQAEKSATREARSELQTFLGLLQGKKEEDQKTHDDYVEKKLRQLEERKLRRAQRRSQRADEREQEALRAEEAERQRMEAFRNAPLKVGEKVRIKESGLVGEVARISTKAVSVIIGNLTSKMPVDKVERISSNEFKTAAKEIAQPVYRRDDAAIRERKLNFKPELDVRGERVTDALDIVMHYIDDALMLGMGSVRIIHGKGTGALREEIQKYLRTVPGVASAKDEHIQLGGSGVTLVTFE